MATTCTVDCLSDAALLEALTAPTPPTKPFRTTIPRRDAALDPLLIAAAAASGPHVTRNHYSHDFFPGPPAPVVDNASFDIASSARKRLTYVSRQAPRRQRLQASLTAEGKENGILRETEPLQSSENLPPVTKKRRPSVSSDLKARNNLSTVTEAGASPKPQPAPRLEIKCMARTRIPTPHGPAFLHLYHNNKDNKEHLAVVVDPAQLEDTGNSPVPAIRSRSLDSVWDEKETEMDRIIRGAYVGRLSSTHQKASDSPVPSQSSNGTNTLPTDLPAPLIRIHSECFTGETIGSMRCDCGEQLDEAIRQISQPITLSNSQTIPGRGAVIYLRQEGRGIGLLSKIRAYNLQDMGHDTVTANLMLGHKADERGYEIAGAILHDLGLGFEGASCSEGVRILTNNPDKVEALKKEGINIVDRVAMVPRSWQDRTRAEERSEVQVAGVTLIGGKTVHGDDLDKYLRTKVLRMGHMLPLWLSEAAEGVVH
ncbi:hypothetical protein D9611_002586 [Ephemerocybe angulata]|uniref:GTP cyclohydrolase II n=1 Tax=Ephemerocybe angulata TaxID=980116 RepID=A0A8H5C1N1_9AGAR|nr:hypothetical protein D9611_002586 [Tulosesus angulatus]